MGEKIGVCLLTIALLGSGSWVVAATANVPVRWDLDKLFQAPVVHPAEGFVKEGVTAVFFDSVPYKGKPTRVFAWYGLPKQHNGRSPGMVLLHGGGGTAYAHWVRMWTDRGYAAIAIDMNGCLPTALPTDPNRLSTRWKRHEFPAGDDTFGLATLDQPVEDQWGYHAVAAAILANSLLRSMPEVDANRIGLTGISLGAYVTHLASAADHRFRCAIPVYAGAFLDEGSAWEESFEKMGKEKAAKWMRLWDPSSYLRSADMPMLWIGVPQDPAYPFNTFTRASRLPSGPRVLSSPVGLPHSHEDGWRPRIISVYADNQLKDGQGFVKVSDQRREDKDGVTKLFFRYQMPPGPAEVIWAELAYTKDSGPWLKRKWQIAPVQLRENRQTILAALPAGATAYYFNIIDSRGACVSTEMTETPGEQVGRALPDISTITRKRQAVPALHSAPLPLANSPRLGGRGMGRE